MLAYELKINFDKLKNNHNTMKKQSILTVILFWSCFGVAYCQAESFQNGRQNERQNEKVPAAFISKLSLPKSLDTKVREKLLTLNQKQFVGLSHQKDLVQIKQDPVATNQYIRLGGYALYDPASSMKCPNVFSMDLSSPAQKDIYDSPMNPNNTWGLYKDGITMIVGAGAWTGKEWFVSTLVKEGKNTYLGHWFSFEPITGKVNFIGSGNMGSGYGCQDFAYDYTQNKLYGTSSVGVGCELRLVSMEDTTQTVISIMKTNAADTLKDPLVALACSNEGTLYGISIDGDLYKINKENAVVTLVGNLNTSEKTGAYVQSATFDRITNTLYYQQSATHENLLSIDTLSGKATTLLTGVPEIAGFFHHYYESAVPPSNPTNLRLKVDAENVLKIHLNWINPRIDFNGDSLKNLAKIYIYRGTESSNLSKFDSVITTLAGDVAGYTHSEQTQGVYYYGIEAVTSEKIVSPNVLTGKLSCVQLSLPYSNDFENVNRMEEGCTGDWKRDSSGTYSYNGKVAYIWKNGYTGEVQISGLPMQKDEVYIYSLYAKGKPQYGSSVSPKLWLGIVGDSLRMQTPISLTIDYQKYNVVYKSSVSERVQEYLTFDGTLYPQNYIFSIDNLSVVLASEYPDSVTSLKAEADAQGGLSARISWKNPSINLKGEALSDLQKIYLQYADNANFTKFVQEEIAAEQVGGVMSKDLSFSKPGNWFFRTITVSSIGECPYYGSTYKTWIGLDTVFKASSNFRTKVSAAEGNVELAWDELANKGENGGFLNGSLTGYRVIRNAIMDKKPDTSFLDLNPKYTSKPLDLDLYTFEVRGIRNQKYFGKPASAYSLVGISPIQYLLKNTEAGRKRSTSYPFYVTYSSKNSSSSISQFVYTSTEIGAKKMIDTLIFVKEPATGKAKKIVRQRMQLYMGYKQDSVFTSTSDWVSLTQQTLVYDDTVVFDTLENAVKIGIKPFFYEEGKNIVFTAIKPMQRGIDQGISPYVCSKTDTLYHLTLATDMNPKPTETDFINVKTTPVGPGSKTDNVPVMVLSQMQNLATIKGRVIRLVSQEAVPEFTIKITSSRSDFFAFNYTYKNSDPNGTFEFAHLPAGEYEVLFAAPGFVDSAVQVSIDASQTQIFDIKLKDARKIILSGKVLTPDNKPLEGVDVSLNGLNDYKTLTDAQGNFSFEVYGSTKCTLHFSKKRMQFLTQICGLTNSDTALANIILAYQALLVPAVEANVNEDGSVKITWEKPNGRTKAQWCHDIDVPVEDHCIGTASYGSFKAAIWFAPGDLKNLDAMSKKLYQVRFYSADSTAKYTIRIYQGEKAAEEIYFQRVEKGFLGWNTIQLTTPVSFDTTKNLWIAVEVAAGYRGAPLSFDNGPKTNAKSAWAFLNEKWAEFSDFKTMDANWNLLAFFRDEEEVNAANGYRVYRGLAAESLEKYSLLTPTPVSSLSYTDVDFGKLNYGVYRYALRSDWFNENLSEPSYSNPVGNGVDFRISFVVSSDGAPVQGAKIRLSEVATSVISYQGLANEAGQIEFGKKVNRGKYNLSLSLPNHPTLTIQNIEFAKDTLWRLPVLQELKSNPYVLAPKVSLTRATMEWAMGPSFVDDAEDYFDFSIDNLGMFQMPFKTKKGWIQDIVWKNQDKAQAFVVFNAHETKPMLGRTWDAHSGEKMLAAFYSVKAPNNDWLIRPIAQGGGEFSFYALGVGLKDTKEKFKVLYSKTTADTASFISLTSGNYEEATTDWKEYKYQVPADAKYVAIVYVSNDVFALLLDDLTFKHSSEIKPLKIGNPIGFEVYLDGSKVRDLSIDKTSYAFETLSYGKHQLGVKAMFASGASELIFKEVTIEDTKNITESKANVVIKVYPNPSSTGLYTLYLPDVDQTYEYWITQANGQVVLYDKLKGGVSKLDLSSLPSGIYFMRTESKNISESIKLILNR